MRSFAGEFYHVKKYPNSIATKYMKRTRKSQDYEVLNEIIDEEIKKNMDNNRTLLILPQDDEIVIHVRIGDAIEYNFVQYVKPLSYYTEKVKQFKKYTNSKSIVIVAGSHKDINLDKSMKFLKELQKTLENNDYKVTIKLNNPADDDFLFMTNSRYFISSGGHFSQVIRNIVKLRGGIVE
jgi:hypothetical protein